MPIINNPQFDALDEALRILDASEPKSPAPPDLERARVLLLADLADSMRAVARLASALTDLVEPLGGLGGIMKSVMSLRTGSAADQPPAPQGDPALCSRCGFHLTLHAFVKDGLIPRPQGMCDGAGASET